MSSGCFGIADPSRVQPSMRRLLGEQCIEVDIDLARRADMPDLEGVGSKSIFHEARFLDADHFLPGVGDNETGRGRPDVAGVAKGEIAALVDVAARDQTAIDRREHLDEPARAGCGT